MMCVAENVKKTMSTTGGTVSGDQAKSELGDF
jgi:hypothetical protein